MIDENDFIIGDDEVQAQPHIAFPTVHARGLVPRDYSTHPQGYLKRATPFNLPLVPRSEWAERAKEMEATKSRLSDIRRSSGPGGGPIPSLDQNGIGYCWNHSLTMGNMLLRAIAGLPYVRLSAFFIGCLVKHYRDEGGWGALALEFADKLGIPSTQFWPEKGMDPKYDTPACRENALLHKPTEEWADLSAAVYDRNLTEDQAMTLLFNRCPLVGDFNWWGHSVCLMDPVLLSDGRKALPDFGSLDLHKDEDYAVYASALGKRGINSWTDGWGNLGEFVLTGSKAKLDGGVAPRATTPSTV